MVMVLPDAIVTLSAEVGVPLGVQMVGVFQLPVPLLT